jgi:hypothetical protein
MEAEMESTSNEFKQLMAYCKMIGQDLHVEAGGVNQECERELEEELEEENEQEVETIQKNPFSQTKWDFSAPTSPRYINLFGSVFHQLTKFVANCLSDVKQIRWSHDLYITTNFWKTVQGSLLVTDMSSYLRLVNSMLVFQDGRVVLVSLYELDQLLPHWWKAASRSKQLPCFVAQLSRVSQPGKPRFGFAQDAIPTGVMTSVKLFCGMVQYSDEEREVLKVMLKDTPKPRLIVEKILMKRHQLLYFERSNLEALCDSIDS